MLNFVRKAKLRQARVLRRKPRVSTPWKWGQGQIEFTGVPRGIYRRIPAHGSPSTKPCFGTESAATPRLLTQTRTSMRWGTKHQLKWGWCSWALGVGTLQRFRMSYERLTLTQPALPQADVVVLAETVSAYMLGLKRYRVRKEQFALFVLWHCRAIGEKNSDRHYRTSYLKYLDRLGALDTTRVPDFQIRTYPFGT